jgi:curli biogenesis system outer membrane secretion channel CsgG
MQVFPLVRVSCSALLLAGLLVPTLAVPHASAENIIIAQVQPQQRIRIAVLDFDFASTGLTGSAFSFFGGVGPSQGVSNRLTHALVQVGTFSVIERSRVLAVLAEQDLGQSGLIDPATAAQVGRTLGVDYVVLGSVTRFNLEEGRAGGGILGIGGSSRRVSAEVQLTARLVNTTTAEIVAVAEGSGSDSHRGGGFSLGGLVNFGSDGNNVDELLSNAADTAINQLASQFNGDASRLAALPASLPSVEAVVADVAGGQVIINRGTQDGFRVGMTLSVERVTRQVTDPTTGEVLRTVTAPVGRIELLNVDARSGVGRVVSGTGFRVGDQAIAVQ